MRSAAKDAARTYDAGRGFDLDVPESIEKSSHCRIQLIDKAFFIRPVVLSAEPHFAQAPKATYESQGKQSFAGLSNGVLEYFMLHFQSAIPFPNPSYIRLQFGECSLITLRRICWDSASLCCTGSRWRLVALSP